MLKNTMRILKFRFWKDKKLQGILELKNNNILDMGWEWDSIDQFTGLLDKSGKEIWEGDILKCSFPRETIIGKVIYRQCGALFLVESEPYGFNFRSDIEYEIIGNIYQNGDLLGK